MKDNELLLAVISHYTWQRTPKERSRIMHSAFEYARKHGYVVAINYYSRKLKARSVLVK